jgi:MinD-like ATPase involved in chromosome partitioning or flagellar assembly
VPVDPTTIQLLDRQIIGQAWLRPEQEDQKKHPFRIVFYGLKGGVGRSTTLALLAYRLARDGKKVLLIDFDLESPGLSGLLLPPERVAPFGLVDWFVEDAVGQGDSLLGELVADSPLADDLTGHIRIAAALGQGETAYLAKLARVYADVPTKTGPVRFPERMRKIVQLLEAKEKPDVVLIDSRAGLHDVAAVSIAGLASVALLFITDTPQNWLGYRQLFEHWQRRPEVLRMVRDRLVVVQALFPESDQARRAEQFLQRSYDLFSSTLYDEIDPSKSGDTEAFSFDENSEDAPHYPLRVRWSARLQEFDPLVSVRAGGVDLADIEISMGPFFGEILSLLDGE